MSLLANASQPTGKAGDRSDGLEVLNVVAFAGASNWPLWVGQQFGFFSDQGLDLALSLTPSSVRMVQALQSGLAQIALTSIDNVIAYANGHGEIPLDGPTDFFAFMGLDDGLLSVMARPGIDAIVALRGRTLAVDALTTGFAFVLKEILARNGMGDADVNYIAVGTGAERLAALNEGLCSATLLNAPLCLAAEIAGNTRLVRARDMLGSYQGIVGAARRSWAQDNGPLMCAFIRAFDKSLRWLCDPAHKMEACSILAERLPMLGPAVDRAYRILVSDGGLDRTLEVRHDGTARVIRLREKYGMQQGRLGEPDSYIDDTFRRAALA